MRALALFLVAANLAFLAWAGFLADSPGADPAPLARQVNPGQLRILTDPGPAAAPAAAKPPGPAPQPVAAAPAPCLEWGAFAPAESARASQVLAPLALGERLSERRAEETAGWWVYIPPQGSRAAALKKAAELKGLGVEEYFIMQDEGPSRWALSLGVFSTEEAARSRLESLKSRGVRTAQSGARDTQVPKVYHQVRGADAATEARLREVAAAFPGTEVRACP